MSAHPTTALVEYATSDFVSLAALRLAVEGRRQRTGADDASLDRYTRAALADGGWVDDLRRGLAAHQQRGGAS